MTKKTTKKTDVTTRLASGTTVLGAICHWSLREFKVPRASWTQALGAHGIAEAEVEATPYVVLARTMEQLRGQYAQRRVPGLRGAHALLWVYHDAAEGKTKADHAWSVTLDTAGAVPELRFERKPQSATPDDAANALRAKVEADFAEIRDYALTADLSVMLSRAMPGVPKNDCWEAVSLRDSGGVFFVGPAQVARVEAFRDWVQSVAPLTRLDVLRLTDEAGNRETVARSAGEALSTEMDQIRAVIEKMLADEKPSAKSIERKSAEFRALRARIAIFSDVLGDVGQKLHSRLVEVEEQIRAEVAQVFSAPAPAPEPEPAPEPASETRPEPPAETAPEEPTKRVRKPRKAA